MKKFLFVFLFVAGCSIVTKAQDSTTTVKDTTYWQKGGLISVNFNQVSLVNWTAGGQSSLSGTTIFNGFLNYKRERVSWDNSLDLGYGIIKIGDQVIQKNEDRIIANSKYGKQMKGNWYLSTLMNFRSQFANGYNYPNDSVVVSKFLAPAFLIVSIGFDYKPKDYFSLYLSPATGKFTYVNDRTLANSGVYGNDPAVYDTDGVLVRNGKKVRAEFGAYVSAKFEKNVAENVMVKSRVDLFNNYTDGTKKNRGNIDVNWETSINLKVNKYITTTLFTHLIYDHDILVPLFTEVNNVRTQTGQGRRIQFKELFGISFGYKF